jgi:hypothetical protein
VTLTLVLAAFVAGSAFGWAAPVAFKRRRGPVNIVNGMLLPHPSDERWECIDVSFDCRSELHRYHTVYRLGDVHVIEDCRVHVDKVTIPGAADYRRAVIRAQVERKALAAAIGESP